MTLISSILLAVLVSLIAGASATNSTPVSAAAIPAFPGAEGYGALAVGGRGGRVIEVTNLKDSGPGSFRAAVTASGPRIVVFRTSGEIVLKNRLNITEPFLTIAGQTAPGPGITLRTDPDGSAAGGPTLYIQTHEVIVRYLRVRPGAPNKPSGSQDSVTIYSPDNEIYNVILDHISASWSTDETLSISGINTHDITVQWSIISESLNDANHAKGTPHGYGTLLDTNARNITLHHNLYAHHEARVPRVEINPNGDLDMRNNVIYNFGKEYSSLRGWNINYVGNYIKSGPNSNESKFMETLKFQIYLNGNVLERRNGAIIQAGVNDLVEPIYRDKIASTPYAAPRVTTTSAEQALQDVLALAGSSLSRDSVDIRIINDVANGTGRIINCVEPNGTTKCQKNAGGWPVLQVTKWPSDYDSDHDGMEDAWELQNGFDPTDGTDGNGDADGDGYTNVEEFLNFLASSGSTDPSPPSNFAPSVNAGIDQTITLSETLALNGAVVDDGLPTGSVTSLWSTINSPGVVTFANDTAPVTTATFSTEGVYVLRLMANDGEQTSNDDLQVDVNPGPPSVDDSVISMELENYDNAEALGGHSWQTVIVSGSSGGTAVEATPNNGALVDTGYASSSPRIDLSTTFDSTGPYYIWARALAPTSGDNSFYLGLNGADEQLNPKIGITASSDWNWSNLTLAGQPATLDIQSVGVHIVSVWMREDGITIDKLVLTTDPNYVPTGTGPVENRIGETNVAPFVNAGPDLAITEGQALSVDGSFSDPTSISWTATVDYGDQTGAQTLALVGTDYSLDHIFVNSGIYSVAVSVIDNQGAVGADTFEVTVQPLQASFPSFPGAISSSTDIDGDGLVEDLNGNDRFDFSDVALFFEYLSYPEVQDNPIYFDFNRNDIIDFDDVVALFDMLVTRAIQG